MVGRRLQGLGIAQADLIGGSMGGWVAMHRAINAPDSIGKLVLLGPMGLPSWRSTLKLLGPMLSLALRPTDAKRDEMMRCGFGDGERVNRELSPWMKIAGKCRGRVGWPFTIPDAALRTIKAPTLLFLGGQDGAVGSATAAANRARRTVANCQIKILPKAGHLMLRHRVGGGDDARQGGDVGDLLHREVLDHLGQQRPGGEHDPRYAHRALPLDAPAHRRLLNQIDRGPWRVVVDVSHRPVLAGFAGIWPFSSQQQAEAAQRGGVAEGHQPWLLDPRQVAGAFAGSVLGWVRPATTQTRPGTVLLTWSGSSDVVRAELAQPVRQGSGGVWMITRVVRVA